MRQVLQNMLEVKRDQGSAFVRIGTTGRGIAPHYRVDPGLGKFWDTFIEDDLDGERISAHYVAFHGRNHQRLPYGRWELREEHWSGAEMSIEDVKNLLGELRKWKK